MKITQFLEGRDAERQAVTRYIYRHNDFFQNHISKDGREIELDDIAVAELDKQYPLVKPVMVVEGVPQEEYISLQNELIEAQKTVCLLQSRLLDAQEQIAVAEASKILLEDKKQQILSKFIRYLLFFFIFYYYNIISIII